MTSTMTTPATRVRFREEKNAPMVFLSSSNGSGAKSLAPSAPARENACGRGGEHHDLGERDRPLEPLTGGEEKRHDAGVTRQRDQAEEGNRREVQVVRL